jgi:hypothetical protein
MTQQLLLLLLPTSKLKTDPEIEMAFDISFFSSFPLVFENEKVSGKIDLGNGCFHYHKKPEAD